MTALATLSNGLKTALWHAAALTLVTSVPVWYRTGSSAWNGSLDTLSQAGFAAVAYLLAVLLTSLWRPSSRAWRALTTLIAVGVAVAAVAAAPLLRPDIPLSRTLLAVAGGITLAALEVLALLPSLPLLAVGALGAAAVVSALAGAPKGDPDERRIESQYYALRLTVSRPPEIAGHLEVEGGGLAVVGDQLLLVTGAGQFARLRVADDRKVAVDLLPATSPANVDAFRADAPEGVMVQWFRVMDMVAERVGDGLRVSVSHHYWNQAEKCFVLRVSSATVSSDLQHWGPWQSRFDAQPCLPIKSAERSLPFYGSESGGRLLLTPQGLLVSVGDHAFDGFNADRQLAQDPESHYGKTVLVTSDGHASVFTSGHRNPQGLALDAAGRVWETEHGPRGGDELNLLAAGGNFGWPWRTFGTEYAMRRWPPLRRADAAFTEPALAFVPSRGISNLVAPGGDRFANWAGDLLIGTLKGHQLVRVRLDGDRPVYVEDIDVGFEVRDLVQAADGRLIVWTDEGAILAIEPDAADSQGDALIARCTGCHTLNQGQFGALGPNLYGVVGRPIASAPGFNYSGALKGVGGRWTAERLDAFLADPKAFAPGTTMAMGVRDAEARRLIVEFLRTVDARR